MTSLVLAGLNLDHSKRFRVAGTAGNPVPALSTARATERPAPIGAPPRIGPKVTATSVSRAVLANGEVFYTRSFADHITEGDTSDGEDLLVRQAAVAALARAASVALPPRRSESSNHRST
jgi:hypothetical protein